MSEQTTAKKVIADSECSLSAVPAAKKVQGLWAAMVVLVGFTFFSPSMTAGGNLGIGLTLNGFLLAMILGNAFLGVYCGLLGYIGQKTGLTLDLMAHRSFGEKGSYLPSALISFTQIGWFGVGVAMFAIPVSGLTGGRIPVWALIIITGTVMTATAYLGIRALAVLGSIAVPLIAVLGLYSVGWGVDKVGGFMNVFAQIPQKPISLATGIAIVVGSFISGGTATPNFTRFSKTPRVAVLATVVAFFVGNSVMMIFGAVGGAVTGVADIFDILILQGLAIPAILTLGLNIWTTNNNALYTGGLGLTNITGLRQKPMVLVSGIIGTLAAIWLYNNFVGWLSFLNATLPPVGAIVMLDFVMHRPSYREGAAPAHKVHWGSIAGVIVGAAVGNFVPVGIASINAMIAACVCYLLADRLFYAKQQG